MSDKLYSVWVGGVEVNNFYLAKKDAFRMAGEWINDGYDDVQIAEVTLDDGDEA